jgi:hypothetical protein
MAGKGWERYLFGPLVRAVRGEKIERPAPVLMGLAPMRLGSPNHVMMARALGIEWLTRWQRSAADREALRKLEKIVREDGEAQVRDGIWTMGATSEQFAPDPHSAYYLLPALVFAQHPATAEPWRRWWQGTIYAWEAAASPRGEVLLPCGRWAGRFSTVVDACYRNLFGLTHRNNKFDGIAWAKWAAFFPPLSGFAAAVEFEKALRGGAFKSIGAEPPVLALPTTIHRTATGLTATMLPRPGINVTKPAWTVTADWTDQRKPAKWAVSLERPAESATEARRLRLEV